LGNNEISYTLTNETNKIELERNKNELLSFLKAELKNNNIKIHIKVNKLKEKTFIYSSVEKYEKLKKINPRIESLRKEFKLNL
jgi:DNA polymerase-3 subunit gamma/tau